MKAPRDNRSGTNGAASRARSTETLHAYTRTFEALTPQNLSTLDQVMTPDVRFIDPFNDVKGIDNVRAIFAHMYQSLPHARFTILGAALMEGDPGTGYLHWRLEGQTKAHEKSLVITGMSKISFEENRVSSHIDYWDAATNIYERTPVLGSFLKLIRKKVLQTSA